MFSLYATIQLIASMKLFKADGRINLPEDVEILLAALLKPLKMDAYKDQIKEIVFDSTIFKHTFGYFRESFEFLLDDGGMTVTLGIILLSFATIIMLLLYLVIDLCCDINLTNMQPGCRRAILRKIIKNV